MARSEWGPKDASLEKHSLLEITRFSGSQLQDIDSRVTEYLHTNSDSTREEAVGQMAASEKQASRIELALDTLNQLSQVNRSGQDVISVIVRQDVNSSISRIRGAKHLYYEIGWINEPDKKPEPEPVPKPVEKPVAYPFITEKQRAGGDSYREFREKRRQEREEQERIEAERKQIESVVIDIGREVGEKSLAQGTVKIELGEDGSAVILFNENAVINPDGTPKYVVVDRKTGEYNDWYAIRPEVLLYYEVQAQKLEGKDGVYTPSLVVADTLQETYDLAVKRKIITVQYGETGVGFYYHGSIWGSSVSWRMDLKRELAIFSSSIRPLNPQFVDFLKKKKAELEQEMNLQKRFPHLHSV